MILLLIFFRSLAELGALKNEKGHHEGLGMHAYVTLPFRL
jgi:hypothetical protein